MQTKSIVYCDMYVQEWISCKQSQLFIVICMYKSGLVANKAHQSELFIVICMYKSGLVANKAHQSELFIVICIYKSGLVANKAHQSQMFNYRLYKTECKHQMYLNIFYFDIKIE